MAEGARSTASTARSSTRTHSQTSIKSIAETAFKEGLNAVSEVFDDVATLMDAERPEHLAPQKPLRTAAVVFNLSNTTMGVGILTLAVTFADAGMVLGTILLILCAIATHFSVQMLCRIVHLNRATSDSSGVASMEALAEYCMGKLGKYWIQTILVVICLGTQVAYLVSLKSLLYSSIIHLVSDSAQEKLDDAHLNEANCMLIVLFCVSLPLSFLKRIDALAFTSFLSVSAIFYFVVISVVYLAVDDTHVPCDELNRTHHDDQIPDDPLDVSPPSPMGVLSAFNIISISYICQLTVAPILKELAKGQQYGASAVPVKAASDQLATAMWLTMCVACVLYSGAGYSGYITWRQLTTKPSTILACYPPDKPEILVVYFGMSVMLAFSYPLIGFTNRQTIHHLVWPDKPLDNKKHIGITIGITCVCAPVAYFATQLSTVLSIVSAITAPSLCYLLPGVWYLRAHKLELEDYERLKAKKSMNGADEGAKTEKTPLVAGGDAENADAAQVNMESQQTSVMSPSGLDDEAYGYMTRDEVVFMWKERAYVRKYPTIGWVMVVLGGAMQLACILAVGLQLAGINP